AGEAEAAARTEVADLRLPVIQVVPNQIEAEANLVSAFGPGQVVAVRVAFFDAEQRHPVGNDKSGVVADRDIRKSALPNSGSVHVGDTELQTVVCAVVVGKNMLILALVTNIGVQHHIGADGSGISNRGDLDGRIALAGIGAAKPRSASNTEYSLASGCGPHASVLHPERILVAVMPVNLQVKLIAIENRTAAGEVVVGEG